MTCTFYWLILPCYSPSITDGHVSMWNACSGSYLGRFNPVSNWMKNIPFILILQMRKVEEFTKVTWLVMVEPSFKPVSSWFLKALLKTEGYPCSAGAVAGRHLLHLFQQHTHEESPLQLTSIQAIELRPVWLSEVKVAQSSPTLCDPMDCSPWNSPGQNTGVRSLPLHQGIFPTQGLLRQVHILNMYGVYLFLYVRSCVCEHLLFCALKQCLQKEADLV